MNGVSPKEDIPMARKSWPERILIGVFLYLLFAPVAFLFFIMVGFGIYDYLAAGVDAHLPGWGNTLGLGVLFILVAYLIWSAGLEWLCDRRRRRGDVWLHCGRMARGTIKFFLIGLLIINLHHQSRHPAPATFCRRGLEPGGRASLPSNQ